MIYEKKISIVYIFQTYGYGFFFLKETCLIEKNLRQSFFLFFKEIESN